MSYDRSEVDAFVDSLNSRIDASNVTLNTVNSAVAAHNVSPDAHNTIFVTKATKTTVSELSDTVDSLMLRVQNLENVDTLKGTLDYYLFGVIGETSINVIFDIQPIDENHPVTYEVYGNGTLIEGLTFDASSGTITGTPMSVGTATYTVLAKSGSYGAFITVKQDFEGEVIVPPDNTVTKGYAELSEIVTKLRSGNISDLVIGTKYTITMADDTLDKSRKITYNDLEYVRYPLGDTDTLYAWANANSRIYTDEIAIIANAVIKDVSGNTIGTLATTPSYMKEYNIRITSVDTDEPTAGTYAHNARFEFVNIVGDSAYDYSDTREYQTSDIRSYLTSEDADGFMVRLPADIRGLIVPNNIECVTSSTNTVTLSDKVFLPSAWELCGTTYGNWWFQEGTKSTYYPTSYISEDKRKRYNFIYRTAAWLTRTVVGGLKNQAVRVSSSGSVVSSLDVGLTGGIAPAFVIA